MLLRGIGDLAEQLCGHVATHPSSVSMGVSAVVWPGPPGTLSTRANNSEGKRRGEDSPVSETHSREAGGRFKSDSAQETRKVGN